MTPAVENTGNDVAEHLNNRIAINGPSTLCSIPWFSAPMKSECCSPSQQAPRPITRSTMDSEAGSCMVTRTKEASSLPHWMESARVPDRNGEKGFKADIPSPGPSTPMQAPPMPQQKPREAPESYTIISSTSMAQAFQPMKAIWGSYVVPRPFQIPPAPKQDAVQSQKENALSLSPPNLYPNQGSQAANKGVSPVLPALHRVGQPPLNRALATLGTPKAPPLNDDLQLHLHSKSTQGEPSQSSFSVGDQDRFNLVHGRPSLGPKTEPVEYLMNAGLSLGFNPPQNSGSHRTPPGQATQVWGIRNGGLSFTPKTPSEEFLSLQLSQGGACNGQVGTSEEARDHSGNELHLQGESDRQHKNFYQNGDVEHSISQVQERFIALQAECSANPFTDSLYERPKKRMKRRMLDPTITSYEARERNLDMDEDQDSERNGNFLFDHEDSGNSCPLSGLAKSPLQGSREKVLDKVLAKILEMPISEPRTMVVKKTPKRVHNSNPNLLPTRAELSMLESLEIGDGRRPQTFPHFTFTPPVSTAGINGKTVMSDLTSSRGAQIGSGTPTSLVSELEDSDLESSQGAQDCTSGWQYPPGLRPYTVQAYSPMPTPKQTLSVSKPSLPLTLNFSPKLPGPVVLSPKASTGIPSAEEEWGKSLALSATSAASPTEVGSSISEPKLLTYQERFIQLQGFLKKCDEDDQSYLMQALQSLSAPARSGHAVNLEQRAMWLSIEEGKEMARVKSLNVMGQRNNSRVHTEVGCTPQGPRIPAFSTPTTLFSRQKSLTDTSSPLQMDILMSGSTPASAQATPNFA